jgi:Protein of unknown function (DUF3995)
MKPLAGTFLVTVFLCLATLHVYWALGGQFGKLAAVPRVEGRTLFRPTPVGTLAVAAALVVAAGVVAGTLGWLGRPVPTHTFRLLLFAMSIVFVLRAVGDFHYVGFFRSVGEGPFGYWDLRLYSPLCLLIAMAAFFVGWRTPGPGGTTLAPTRPG